ncbi:LysR family transcriptional regulator [Acinetobacter puyangensis]|uniref:Transcriptional regulator, LysR family n=1 Tax=Acinetobacter puyangensis TaxID=1096779 RepID=A0A240E6D1_9GAMM|nr:LysR family transcriptional regulator [Acinetobacter puyangensis]SNX44317.1 transcriptional regulator, LysR family [Acinetobacter puyangensis]
MTRENLNDLMAFNVVARERSFTKAAAQLGVSQSSLSHTVKALEERLGVKLLTRTTRSVSLTETGERLFNVINPRFGEIEEELVLIKESKDKPAGTIRITAAEHAAMSVLWPKLFKILPDYPDINVEITIDYTMTDIVANRYDAGVRLGGHVAKDMLAVKISPDLRMAVVGTPKYFTRYLIPNHPEELEQHNCINRRLPTYGGIYSWELSNGEQKINVRTMGQIVVNSSSAVLRATLETGGLGFIPEDMVLSYISEGKLIRVLDDWCQPFEGYYIYYVNRQKYSLAFQIIIDALKQETW